MPKRRFRERIISPFVALNRTRKSIVERFRRSSRLTELAKYATKPGKGISKWKRRMVWGGLILALWGATGLHYYKQAPHKFVRFFDSIGLNSDKPKSVTITAYDGKKYTYEKALIPEEVRFLTGDNCALYLRTVGNMLGLDYRRANASWEMPGNNHVAWKAKNEHDKSYESALRFGRAVCIYNPLSMWNTEGRPFTHVALVLGKENGRWVVWHDYHGKQRMDYLDWVLENLVYNDQWMGPGKVVEVMAPRNDPEFVERASQKRNQDQEETKARKNQQVEPPKKPNKQKPTPPRNSKKQKKGR